jgi:hypothetical protein
MRSLENVCYLVVARAMGRPSVSPALAALADKYAGWPHVRVADRFVAPVDALMEPVDFSRVRRVL